MIGATDRYGVLRIEDTSWDHNGTLRVIVTDLRGHDNHTEPNATREARVRALANRALEGHGEWRRITTERLPHADYAGCDTWRVRVRFS